ncbi:hypothetical protein Q3G72_027617 [Acer saccharum]|nr:hypothetical protein Q3G72_027617 [Acer saccharum]
MENGMFVRKTSQNSRNASVSTRILHWYANVGIPAHDSCTTRELTSVPGEAEDQVTVCWSLRVSLPAHYLCTVVFRHRNSCQFNYRNHCRLAVAVLPCGGRTAKWRPLIEMLLFCHKRCRFGYCDHCAVVLDHRNWDWA